jgi:hypothetical protein
LGGLGGTVVLFILTLALMVLSSRQRRRVAQEYG